MGHHPKKSSASHSGKSFLDRIFGGHHSQKSNDEIQHTQPKVQAKEISCNSCQQLNPVNAKFCSNCGDSLNVQKQESYCSQCGSPLLENAKFCTRCGTKQ